MVRSNTKLSETFLTNDLCVSLMGFHCFLLPAGHCYTYTVIQENNKNTPQITEYISRDTVLKYISEVLHHYSNMLQSY